jgi:hypothetical protein
MSGTVGVGARTAGDMARFVGGRQSGRVGLVYRRRDSVWAPRLRRPGCDFRRRNGRLIPRAGSAESGVGRRRSAIRILGAGLGRTAALHPANAAGPLSAAARLRRPITPVNREFSLSSSPSARSCKAPPSCKPSCPPAAPASCRQAGRQGAAGSGPRRQRRVLPAGWCRRDRPVHQAHRTATPRFTDPAPPVGAPPLTTAHFVLVCGDHDLTPSRPVQPLDRPRAGPSRGKV